MRGDPLAPFKEFLDTISRATNETQRREAFIILAARGFGETELATELALGAEYQVRFKSAGLVRRGAVDAFYGNLVIEFEADLSRTLGHALEQLRGYVAGAWSDDGNTDRPYLAVASDGARWEVFAPCLKDPVGPIDAQNIELMPSESYVPTGKADAQVLQDFLNHLFFRKTLLRPTTANFARDFGIRSPAFLGASNELGQKLREIEADPQLAVLRRAWSDSLQISYGSIQTDDQLFIKHTYLAVLARLLVWAAMERKALSASELEDVLTGRYFVGRRLANLVEDDFFRWYTIPGPTDASRVWIALSRHLAGYDLTAVREDILKPLYEQLVDPDMRHDLGEYYTPDWLAMLVTERLLSAWDWEKDGIPAMLDPTCGSGTFLRTALEVVRASSRGLKPGKLLDQVLSKVIGIDVHPLAVVVARATYVLAIKDLVDHATRPITVPVFLANSLRIKKLVQTPSLFGDRVPLEVDGKAYMVPPAFIHESRLFDEAIEEVMAVARSYGASSGPLTDAPKGLRIRLGNRLDAFGTDTENLVEVLGSMTQHIAQLIRDRRDSVHGFMLKNLYRPAMLRESFDFVIGNPPWLTVGDIDTLDYKTLVIDLATDAKIAPRGAGEQAHTELATIFLSQASSEFLRPGKDETKPRVGLVMPRSVFTATHHRLLREGSYVSRFDVAELWDLEHVTPLFNVPTCVVFASRSPPRPEAIKPGKVIVGHLRKKDLPWAAAKDRLRLVDVKFELAYLGKRSAWRTVGPEKTRVMLAGTVGAARNHYVSHFRQGAILYPQRLFVLKTDGPATREVGTVRVRTDMDAAKTAKVLTQVSVNHVVDSANLYCTAATDHILPYLLTADLWVVLLPTLVDPGTKGFAPVSSHELRTAGRVDTAGWLDWAEKRWAQVRKKDDSTPLHERLDHMGQLSEQAHMKRFIALYTATGKRPVACFVDTAELELPFVARDQTYWASFDSSAEAHYVVALFNSDYVSEEISDWMTRGLFGPRHIHKRVLDVPWPLYAPTRPEHMELADLAASLTEDAKNLEPVPDTTLGRQRVWIREHLDQAKLDRVNVLVKAISGSTPVTMKT